MLLLHEMCFPIIPTLFAGKGQVSLPFQLNPSLFHTLCSKPYRLQATYQSTADLILHKIPAIFIYITSCKEEGSHLNLFVSSERKRSALIRAEISGYCYYGGQDSWSFTLFYTFQSFYSGLLILKKHQGISLKKVIKLNIKKQTAQLKNGQRT